MSSSWMSVKVRKWTIPLQQPHNFRVPFTPIESRLNFLHLLMPKWERLLVGVHSPMVVCTYHPWYTTAAFCTSVEGWPVKARLVSNARGLNEHCRHVPYPRDTADIVAQVVGAIDFRAPLIMTPVSIMLCSNRMLDRRSGLIGGGEITSGRPYLSGVMRVRRPTRRLVKRKPKCTSTCFPLLPHTDDSGKGTPLKSKSSSVQSHWAEAACVLRFASP